MLETICLHLPCFKLLHTNSTLPPSPTRQLMAPGLSDHADATSWTRTEALKAKTSQSFGKCQSFQTHRKHWHDFGAAESFSYRTYKTTNPTIYITPRFGADI